MKSDAAPSDRGTTATAWVNKTGYSNLFIQQNSLADVTLICYSSGGNATATATVTVNPSRFIVVSQKETPMPNHGRFDDNVFDEPLFGDRDSGVRAIAWGGASATCSASGIRATAALARGGATAVAAPTRLRRAVVAAIGNACGTLGATRIRHAAASAFARAFATMTGTRVRGFPPLTGGLRVMRWSGPR